MKRLHVLAFAFAFLAAPTVHARDGRSPANTAAAAASMTLLPQISVSPASVIFGRVRVSQSELRTVTVTNIGDADLSIGRIALDNPLGPPFELLSDDCSLALLAPSASCDLTLSMSPTEFGIVSELFSIPSDDPVTPNLLVGVSGSGTRTIEIVGFRIGDGIARCQNLATGQVILHATSDSELHCEEVGFLAEPGAHVSIAIRGPALVDDLVSGQVDGMRPLSVRCQNLTTGQSFDLTPTPVGGRVWNCAAAGLGVTTGDQIQMIAVGIAD